MSNWQNTSVFFINFGGMEKFKPFFNKSISSAFNQQSDKFVNGSDLFLVKSHNFFLCISAIFFTAFLTFLCIGFYITNQVIPSHLDLIFFVNSASNFFFSLSRLCRTFFKRRFLMYVTSYLLLNGMYT